MEDETKICKCGSEMKEYTRPRSRPVYCCFDCFDFEKKTGMFSVIWTEMRSDYYASHQEVSRMSSGI